MDNTVAWYRCWHTLHCLALTGIYVFLTLCVSLYVSLHVFQDVSVCVSVPVLVILHLIVFLLRVCLLLCLYHLGSIIHISLHMSLPAATYLCHFTPPHHHCVCVCILTPPPHTHPHTAAPNMDCIQHLAGEVGVR